MTRALLAATLCLTVLGTPTLCQTVTYDYDRTADFGTYRKYAWTRGTELPDQLNHTRIVRLIDAALTPKGLTRVEAGDNPDVLISYHASFDENLRIDGFASGWGPFGLGPDRSVSATVQKVLVGTLVVDVIDARKRALVWRGMAGGDLRPGDKPEQREKKMAKATEKLFKNYPPRS